MISLVKKTFWLKLSSVLLSGSWKKNMEEQKLSQTELAKRLHTSRSGLKRLLDKEHTSITLNR